MFLSFKSVLYATLVLLLGLGGHRSFAGGDDEDHEAINPCAAKFLHSKTSEVSAGPISNDQYRAALGTLWDSLVASGYITENAETADLKDKFANRSLELTQLGLLSLESVALKGPKTTTAAKGVLRKHTLYLQLCLFKNPISSDKDCIVFTLDNPNPKNPLKGSFEWRQVAYGKAHLPLALELAPALATFLCALGVTEKDAPKLSPIGKAVFFKDAKEAEDLVRVIRNTRKTIFPVVVIPKNIYLKYQKIYDLIISTHVGPFLRVYIQSPDSSCNLADCFAEYEKVFKDAGLAMPSSEDELSLFAQSYDRTEWSQISCLPQNLEYWLNLLGDWEVVKVAGDAPYKVVPHKAPGLPRAAPKGDDSAAAATRVMQEQAATIAALRAEVTKLGQAIMNLEQQVASHLAFVSAAQSGAISAEEVRTVDDIKALLALLVQSELEAKTHSATVGGLQEQIKTLGRSLVEATQRIAALSDKVKNAEALAMAKAQEFLPLDTLEKVIRFAAIVYGDRLEFLPDAFTSAKDSSRENPGFYDNPQILLEVLKGISAMAMHLQPSFYDPSIRLGKDPLKTFKDNCTWTYAPNETEQTRGIDSYARTRLKQYLGEQIEIVHHVGFTRGRNVFRIYFAPVESVRKLVIGHLGTHLPIYSDGN